MQQHLQEEGVDKAIRLRLMLIGSDKAFIEQLQQQLSLEQKQETDFFSREQFTDALAYLSNATVDLILLTLTGQEDDVAANIMLLKALAVDAPVLVIGQESDETIAEKSVAAGASCFLFKAKLNGFLLRQSVNGLLEHRLIERKLQKARQLEQYLAYYDATTSLPNRKLFIDRLSQTLTQAKRDNFLVALVFLDLDGFKRINDVFGHSAGDKLLRKVADALTGCVRESDTVARIGSDEFAVVLSRLHREHDTAAIAQKLLAAFTRPVNIEGQEFYITASMGITVFPADGGSSEILLKNADIALHRSKGYGKNNYQFFNVGMDAITFERMEMENQLRKALDHGEFFLHYQPIVNAQTEQVESMEALVRWRHPEMGTISPAKFIPLAEETGLIVPLGEWVLRTACQQNHALQQSGFEPLRISVNLSGRQFREKNLPSMILTALEESGMDANYLSLEITETSVMQNPKKTVGWLQTFKELGIRISVDDFGTGYSSLSYLKRLPLDNLKIDRAFVCGIPEDREDLAIISAIIALAHKLGLKVIAEGVETSDQATLLRSMGCDKMQGFYFSRPVKFEELTRMLTRSSGRTLESKVLKP